MIRGSRWNTGVSSLVALVAIFAVACPTAQAQVKHFKIVGAGIAPQGLPLPGQPARPHWAIGEATRLGEYFGAGSVETNTANFLPNGHITGLFDSGEPFVFTGENGDILACDYGHVTNKPGTFELIPLPELGAGIYRANFIAEFVPIPGECTGKFAGVTGSWIMYAFTGPFRLGASDPIFYVWEGEGSLTFKKGH